MKSVGASFLVLLCLGAGPASQPARDLPPTYECKNALGAIEVEWSLGDAAWAAAPWTEDFIDIVGTGRSAPLGTNDKPPPLRTRARVLWDERCLYVAAELTEDRVAATIRQRDAQLYTEQAFEMFLDPGGDGRDYLEFQINPLNTVCDLLMSKPYRDRGKADISFNLEGFRSAIRVRGTANDATDVDEGWDVELAIPWPALKLLTGGKIGPPREGERWRVNFARMRPGERQGEPGTPGRDLWVWSAQGAVNMHLPERWGWVQFTAAKPEGP